MKVEFEFEEYSKKKGFSFPTETNSAIQVYIDRNYPAVTINANKEGLLRLGKTLIKLAQPDVPGDYHLHFDAGNLLTAVQSTS